MQTTNMLANSTYARNEVRYDSLGHMVQHAAPCTYSTPATACIYWTTTTYDVRNRPVEVQRPINQNNSTPQSTAYSYAGRTTVITDPYSQTRTLITDVNGWLRKTTDTYGYSVTLGYDQAGSNTSRTDSDGNTLLSATYAYGVGAFKVIAHDADLGNWSYDYDALGEVTGWWDANNQGAPTAPFTMVYDALGRPQSRSEPDYYTYWTYGSSATGHNIGKLQSVCTGLGIKPSSCTGTGYSESEAYDSIGRLYQKAINIPGVATYTYTWGYSATTGLLNTLTYPTSISGYAFKLQYGYQNGILDAVTDTSDTPNVTLWTGNTVNADQQVTEETLGNGIVTNRSYDDVTHWLNSIQSGVGGGAGVQNQAFLFDEVGDVTERQDNNRGLTEDIYYDNDYRLSYTKLNGTQNLSISYADNGNITSRSDVNGGKTWVYEYNGKIHAVALDGSALDLFGYDANGNTTLRYRNTITWSSYNYPTAISAGFGSTAESVSLAYGPDRQRWSQYYTGNGDAEQTYYVGGLMDVVTAGSITTYRHYIQVGNEQVAIYSRTNTGTNAFDYVLSDHQGSVASITNASGAVVTSESYTPFGSRRNPSTWSGAASNSDLTASAAITRQGYTFQTQLGLWMGLNHMNGRVQDAITGRFLSPDPVVQAPDVTDSYNRYSYTSNNPLSYTDPSGFEINLLCQICAYGGDVDGAGIDSGEWDCYGNCGQGFANSLPNSIGSSSYNSSVASDFLAEQGNSSAANAIGLNQSFDSSLGSGPVDQFNQYGMDAGLIDPTDLMSPLQLTEWAFKTVGESVANNADTLALGLWNRISNLDSPLAGAGPLALGETLAEAAEGAATATEGAEAAGEFSLYDSTGGLKGLNTNVTADEFSANLQANGYTAAETTGKNGSVTVLQNGQGSTWTIYTRSSTGDMGAQFIGPNGQFLKYNLGVQGLPLPGP
jgi:RHS repeat-associated protein